LAAVWHAHAVFVGRVVGLACVVCLYRALRAGVMRWELLAGAVVLWIGPMAGLGYLAHSALPALDGWLGWKVSLALSSRLLVPRAAVGGAPYMLARHRHA
jgi:hypothetical protein